MINKAIIVGRLGQDPEIRYTPNGVAVANFTVATSETWKDKETGEKREKTEWHRIVVWNKTAEFVGEYLGKGRQVYVEGKLQTRKWEKDGQNHYTTEIVATVVQALGSRNDGAGGGSYEGNNQNNYGGQGGQAQPQNQGNPNQGQGYPEPVADYPDDDIPF